MSRLMTQEEKEKLLKGMKVECEQEKTEKQLFEDVINDYVNNMKIQVKKLDDMLIVHNSIAAFLGKYLIECPTYAETIKGEIEARKDLITKAKLSRNLMQERVDMSEKILKFVDTDFENISKTDFFFQNCIGIEGNKKHIEDELDKISKE